MTADEVARSRVPDRIVYTDWENVYADTERVRQVATDVRGRLFPYVHEYTEVRDHRVIDRRRRRVEYWYEKARTVPRLTDDGNSNLVIEADHVASQTVARAFWEYESDIRDEQRRNQLLG